MDPNQPLLKSVQVFKTYTTRWFILLTYLMLSSFNAIIWIAFAPIASASKEYFQVDASRINLLSAVFLITFFPGTAIAAFISKRCGTRIAIYVGAFMQALGGLIRASLWFHNTSYTYERVLIGQILAGLGQPCITTISSRIAAVWFPVAERTMATFATSMSYSVGIAIGQVVPSLLVSLVTKEDGIIAVIGMERMLLIQGGLVLFAAFMALVIWEEKPPTPPSAGEANRELLSTDQPEGSSSSSSPLTVSLQQTGIEEVVPRPTSSFLGDYKILFKNGHFLLLTVAFSFGLGIFNVIATLISQIVGPCGYEKDAGVFGFLIIIVGLVSSAIVLPAIGRCHAFRATLRITFILSFLAIFGVFFALREDNRIGLYVAFGVLGAVMLPILPVVLESAAECTYPLSEQTGAGFLMVAGQIPSLLFVFLLGSLLDKAEFKECHNTHGLGAVYSQFCLALAGVCFIALACTLCYNGTNLRLAQENKTAPLEHDVEVGQGVGVGDARSFYLPE